MRIAIMGSGGIGGYVGARLADSGNDVVFIARGAHLEAMRKHGLRLLSPSADVHLAATVAVETPADLDPVDVIVFAVKLWDTDAAAASLAPIVGPETRIITFQNGIDGATMLARHLPRDQVVRGAIYISAHIEAPGVVRHPGGPERLIVDGTGGAAARAFQAACRAAVGLACEVSDAIDVVLWEKFVRLTTFSAATALMRSGIGPILADDNARAFVVALLEEAIAIAAAKGHPMRPGFRDETLAFYGQFPPGNRASMTEDLLHGRRLELPWLSARIHALGEAHGIPTPAHTAAFRALSIYVNGPISADGAGV